MMNPFAVILVAAGKSSRFGDPKQKKIYTELEGRAVWLRAIEPFVNRPDVGQLILAIAREDRELFDRRYGPSAAFMNIRVIEGGAERSDTVANALEVVDPRCEFVAVHDAARPCLGPHLIDAVFDAARQHGAALLAVPVAETVKRVGEEGRIVETIPRDGLYLAQTPQVFRRELLCKAYAHRSRVGHRVTDDSQLVEAIGHPCIVVAGSPMNLKITTLEDLKLASAFLPLLETTRRPASAHPFADERSMWGNLPDTPDESQAR